MTDAYQRSRRHTLAQSAGLAVSGNGERGCLFRGGLQILQVHEYFAWAYQSEILARELFDRGGIFPETACRFAQRAILLAQSLNRGRQLFGLLPCLGRRHQPPIADERVGQKDHDGKHEEKIQDTSPQRRSRRGLGALAAERFKPFSATRTRTEGFRSGGHRFEEVLI
jgi:hypothetical protein